MSGQVSAGNEQPKSGGSSDQLSTAELRELVSQANETLLVSFSSLKFSIDEGTNINVVRIEDSETGELIRQIPSEAMVALARAIEERKHGAMLKEIA